MDECITYKRGENIRSEEEETDIFYQGEYEKDQKREDEKNGAEDKNNKNAVFALVSIYVTR